MGIGKRMGKCGELEVGSIRIRKGEGVRGVPAKGQMTGEERRTAEKVVIELPDEEGRGKETRNITSRFSIILIASKYKKRKKNPTAKSLNIYYYKDTEAIKSWDKLITSTQ